MQQQLEAVEVRNAAEDAQLLPEVRRRDGVAQRAAARPALALHVPTGHLRHTMSRV